MTNMLVLNDTSQIANWGTQASMLGLTRMLHEHISDLELSTIAQHSLTQASWRVGLPFGHRTFVGSSSRLAAKSPLARGVIVTRGRVSGQRLLPPNANSFDLAAREWLSAPTHPFVARIFPSIERADVIVHNAELLNYCSNPVGVLGMFLVWLAKKHMGKTAAVINQTTPSTTSDPVMSGILRYVCPELDVVTVRETWSQRCMDEWSLASELVPDPAFCLPESQYDYDGYDRWRSEAGLTHRPYFCLSLSSGLPLAGGAADVANLIEALQRIIPNAVLMAFGGGAWLLRKVARNLRNCVVFDGPFQAVWPLLKRAEFLVSGHYHNIIMASMVGCPFIPFHGVSHKIQGLVELLQWPHRKTYNPTVLSREIVSIVQDAELLVARRESLSAHLLDQCARLAASATATATLLRDALGTA